MKLRLVGAAIAALFLMIGAAGTAQAYDEPVPGNLGGSAADGEVAPGATFTLTGDFGGTYCDWTSAFAGSTGASGSGTSFAVEFTAPEEEGDYALTISCTYEDNSDLSAPSIAPGGALVVTPAALQTKVLSFPIAVADPGSGDSDGDTGSGSGVLPDTGGSNAELLWIGLGLVAAGSVVTVANQRRKRA